MRPRRTILQIQRTKSKYLLNLVTSLKCLTGTILSGGVAEIYQMAKPVIFQVIWFSYQKNGLLKGQRQAEFAAEEERLKKDELEKWQLTRGLAADDRADEDPAGPGTADGRRAMRTLFSLMDWNSNGTVERYDILAQ